jgi:SWI/SNF-related matrix-associated actin-dependent regulator of chromatin subfamily A3
MSGRSTPKRQLDVDGNDTVETHEFEARRFMLQAFSSTCGEPSSSSQRTYGRRTNVQIFNPTRQDSLSREIASIHSQEYLSAAQGSTVLRTSQLLDLPYHITRSASTYIPKDNTQDEEICFGMLRDVQIRMNQAQGKQSLDFHDMEKDGDSYAHVDLDMRDNQCDILAKGIQIATMNRKTHIALTSISSASLVKYASMIPWSELQKFLATAAKPVDDGPKSLTSMISILMFGPRSIGDTIAKELSRYHLFLQHPLPMPTQAIYDNPQYFGTIGSAFLNGALLPPMTATSLCEHVDQSRDLDLDDVRNLATVIDNLPKHDYLKEASVDLRITAPLLR